jgi:hypothetical protein
MKLIRFGEPNVPTLVSYVSQFMTLLPGDIISTGTPAGVSVGMKPQQYLNPEDVVEPGIDQLGESRQNVVARRLQLLNPAFPVQDDQARKIGFCFRIAP